jgi:hypothetical protein
MTDAKKPGKRIIDVAHPGQTAPSKTSKPVIITNRTILKDPMMVDDEPETSAETPVKSVKATAPTLSPSTAKAALTKDDTPEEPAAPIAEEPKEPEPTKDSEPDTEPEAKPAEEPETKPEPAAEPTETPEPESEPEAEPEAETETEEKPEKDTAAMPASLEAQAEATAKAEADHDAGVQKLVDSKQYYLPINSVEKRKTRRFIVLGLLVVILLALAWADVALDAGLIHVDGVQPLTHFFSN